jgi:hypothetical protein
LTAWLPDSAVFRRISRQDAKPQRRKQLALMNNFVSLFILYFAFAALRLCVRSFFLRDQPFRVPPSACRVPYFFSVICHALRCRTRISYLDNDYGNWDRKRRGARTAMFNPHYCAVLTSLRELMVVIERNSETSFTKESQSSQKLS